MTAVGAGLAGPDERQHKKSESRGPRKMRKHEFTPLMEESQTGGMFPGHRVGRGPELRPATGGFVADFDRFAADRRNLSPLAKRVMKWP